jgi:hypothetical protein
MTTETRDTQPQQTSPGKVSVILPYSIANIVFIQALPYVLVMVFGLVMLIIGAASILTGHRPPEDMLLPSVLMFVIPLVAIPAWWWALWRWALRGSYSAVLALYVIYVPHVAFAVLWALSGWVQARRLIFAGGNIMAGLIATSILGVIAVTLIVNLFEDGLWDFAKLDGRCPACRKWRFGRVKRPLTKKCLSCGATLEFVRSKD